MAKQVARIQTERAEWLESGGNNPAVARELNVLEKAVSYTSRLSDPEFVQSTLSIELLRDVIQRSIDRYSDDPWRECFAEMYFTFDEKLPGRLSQGQKYANAMYMPVLDRNPSFDLRFPQQWAEGQHPFIANFTADGMVSTAKLFHNGIIARSSRCEPGLQIADVIASVVRRSVLRTDPSASVSAAFDFLRSVLSDSEGRCLQIYRYEGGHEGIPEIYRPLYALPGTQVGLRRHDRFRL